MDLTKVSARIRPRMPYEAMDLGFLMVRRWWKELFLMQVLLFGVLGVLFYLLFHSMTLVLLLLWWFKPVIETFHLQFLGRALFDENLHAQSILRHKWSVLFHELFAKLTWRRFHPLRSFVMPVAELEQLSGKTRFQRIRILSRTSAGPALWLTSMGAMVETIFTMDILLVAFALLPKEVTDRIDWNQILSDEFFATWVSVAGIIAMFLVMPFYVASGFSLYINRRTWLEGWDIELTFKQLRHRLEKNAKPSALCILVVFLPLCVPSQPLQARPLDEHTTVENTSTLDGEPTLESQRIPDINPHTLRETRSAVIDILEGPDFRRLERREVLRPMAPDASKEKPRSLRKLFAWFAKIGEWIARTTEILMWTGIAITAVILLRFWPRFRQQVKKSSHRGTSPSMDVVLFDPESPLREIPVDIAAIALRYWHEGNSREALSLLYRGALFSLIDRFHLPLDNSFTEIESVELCQQKCPAVVGTYFNRLTQAWMRLAYGHREISAQEFEDLVKGWNFFHPSREENSR